MFVLLILVIAALVAWASLRNPAQVPRNSPASSPTDGTGGATSR